MKTNVLIGFLLLITIFISCDPAIGYEYYINNKSEKELKVGYIGKGFNDTTMTIIIFPKTEIQFFETEIWGKNPHDEKDNFLQMIDSLSITPTDSSVFLLNYLKRDSWSYDNDIGHFGLIKTGTNIYKLEISNENFEKK